MNKLGRDLPDIQNMNALGLVVSDKKIFHVAPYMSLCITC